MPLTFTCECGEQLAAATEEALVLAAQAHVFESHSAVGVVPSASDVLSMAERASDEEAAGSAPSG